MMIGALLRRWWGGWFHPTHWVKLVSVFLVSFSCNCLLFSDIFIILSIATITLLAYLNPLHGEGMRMGHGDPVLWKCILIMGGSYSFYTTIMCAISSYLINNWLIMLLSPFGFLIAFSYWFWWKIFDIMFFENGDYKKFGEYPAGNWFIDGPGSCGELSLGAIMFGLPHVIKLMGV